MSARAHGANLVRTPIERVHRLIGKASSSASFASCACKDVLNGPRNAPSPLGSRTTLIRGNASAVSILRYAYLRQVLPRRLYFGSRGGGGPRPRATAPR